MISIITPTYNRAENLKKCYLSLKNQTCKDFQWIIIDDGSSDNTDEVIEEFSKDDFEILYKKKLNGGKHTALNFAIPYISFDLVTILDSDDYLSNDAIEIILKDWEKYKDREDICGLTYLKAQTNGSVIGKKFPCDEYICSFIDARINKNLYGDKFEIFKTEIIIQYPFPVFDGEKFLGESIVWSQIGYKFDTIHINKILYFAEYLEGGLSKSGRALRLRCPLGGMEYAKVHIDKRIKFTVRIKMMLLFICYSKFAKIQAKNAKKQLKYWRFMFNVLYVFGFILYKYWEKKYFNYKKQ